MATALFALVVVSILALGIWNIADINSVSSINRQDAAKAMGLAEAAVAHALSVLINDLDTIPVTWLLLGADSTASTADDGLLVDFGLPSSDQIPDSGYATAGGRYYVTLLDDPGETDGDPLADENGFIPARCTGVTNDGGSATVDVRIGKAMAAVAINGDLTLSGNPTILGQCGGRARERNYHHDQEPHGADRHQRDGHGRGAASLGHVGSPTGAGERCPAVGHPGPGPVGLLRRRGLHPQRKRVARHAVTSRQRKRRRGSAERVEASPRPIRCSGLRVGLPPLRGRTAPTATSESLRTSPGTIRSWPQAPSNSLEIRTSRAPTRMASWSCPEGT